MTWADPPAADAPAPVPAPHRRRWDHLPHATAVQRFNQSVAIRITGSVGSMWCAYVFACIALISLPSAIRSGSVIVIVSWVAQTFLQLVLLSVIIVGQNASGEASDARAAKTLADAEAILDRLDTGTQRGLGEVMAELGHLRGDLGTFVATVSGKLGG